MLLSVWVLVVNVHDAIYHVHWDCGHINLSACIRPSHFFPALSNLRSRPGKCVFKQAFVNEECELRDKPFLKFAFVTSFCNSSQLTFFSMLSSFSS